jgi:high-affinity nickel-transport protein
MGRIVGVTLIVLGVYVVYALARYRGDFRLRSRWMLLFSAARSAYRRLRARFGNGAVVEHEHAHSSTGAYAHHDTEPEDVPSIEGGATAVATATHTHRHAHADPFTDYGTGTSLAVGMLHGVGAETPTQILIFLAAAGAGGAWAGIVVLATFLIGLFVANSIVAVASASGFLAAHGNFRIYAAVSILTAAASLVVGTLLLLGRDAVLPVFFAG